jgi:hypothetical protein
MSPERLLPCSQDSATEPYPGPYRSSRTLHPVTTDIFLSLFRNTYVGFI